jgi:TatD DNase family protein
MGFFLAFGGVVTYPRAEAVRDAARLTPLDRLLVETDAPYLAPVPHRGKRNEPAFLVETARRLSALRGEALEELAAATSANFLGLCRRCSRGAE